MNISKGKNWMPFVWSSSVGEPEKIHFVYSLNPLRILRADQDPARPGTMLVRFVVEQGERYGVDPFKLRGGAAATVIDGGSTLVGIGHYTAEGHAQSAFFFVTDLSQLKDCSPHNICRPTENMVLTRVSEPLALQDHPHMLFPMSAFFRDGDMFMTATESSHNWFTTEGMKESINNFLYKLHVGNKTRLS